MMKSLIIMTGKPFFIVNHLLPSLYNVGNYKGDVLIVDYGEYSVEVKFGIKQNYPKVFFESATKKYQSFTADRFRAFAKILKRIRHRYGVIMHMDDDMEVYGDISPLLLMGENKLCFVEEPRLNDNKIVRKWCTIDSLPIEYWSAIKYERVLNAALFLGPSEDMYHLIRIVSEYIEHDSRFGIDQLILNALVYYHDIPHRVVGREWDYHFYDGFEKIRDMPYFMKGNVYHPIYILHYAGPQPFKKGTDRDTQTKKKNWLFPEDPKPVQEVKPKRNWLFG